MKKNNQKTIKTTFNCPIELRDRLESLINEYIGQYTADEIMEILITKALEKETQCTSTSPSRNES